MAGNQRAFSVIPQTLRESLQKEYNKIVTGFLERRWAPSELSGGRFCEIIYTIIAGYAANKYPASPKKPSNFVAACRTLESNTHVPRSFQILIPRLLPALYEIRNNRGVGHVGGDVDSNHMDAAAVVSLASWIMAELVRVFHNLSTGQAQQLVDSLTERKIPLVWSSGSDKRVLHANLSLRNEILLLISTNCGPSEVSEIFKWTGCNNRSYFNKTLKKLNEERLVLISEDKVRVQLLPPGAIQIEKLVSKYVLEVDSSNTP